ncbi:MAG: HEAT repeat domain-containing protein [Planctomyces sp.]|jgi:putative membrane-bound dehydrogenase-like protein|nr:HEAT repeat domain-containing protein [Planctomyces sp.]
MRGSVHAFMAAGSFLSVFCCPALLFGEEVQIGNRLLRVAEGYEVSLVADATLAERPIAVSRDERGRLYVTDSGGMSERAEQQLEQKPHRIRRLEDTDGDGVYDRSTLFADRMMFPEGCLWYAGSLYVAAPPEIWKLTDDNDDGVADRREVWFDGKTLTGCGNDLHGPYLGLDGRLYWCKGAFAEQQHQLADGSLLKTQSSHIFRAHPDGTHIETVLTGGMDNPVNVAFLQNGERFLSCTFFQLPEAGRRDGLIHAIYGGVYGKKHSSIYAHPMTGDVMPVLSHQGAAAPCGLIAGSQQLFGGGHDQQLFACYFNLHKVVQHRLIPDGPTYRTEDTEFLACEHPDFHPTDVFEDADGSLLIVDTGGWYKVCCPTSQLAKPDVLGAIYRVRRRNSPAVSDALGLQLTWQNQSPQQLAARLVDERLFVQRRATEQLRLLAETAVPVLQKLLTEHPVAAVRRRAVWTLAGMTSTESAATAAAVALADSDASVRQAAAHTIGLFRHQNSLAALLKMAAGDEPGPARAALEAVGRLKNPAAVQPLLELAGDLPAGRTDAAGAPAEAAARIREHALIYALIEIGQPDLVRKGLASRIPTEQRAALTALDQMSGGGLQTVNVLTLLENPGEALRSTAIWIIGRHPDWGPSLRTYFAEKLNAAETLTAEQQTVFRGLLARLASAADIQTLLQEQLNPATRPAARRLALQALADTTLTATPAGWLDAVAALLPQASAAELPLLIAAAENLPQPKDGHTPLKQALSAIGAQSELSTELRLAAIDAAGSGLPLSETSFSLLCSSLQSDLPAEQRGLAARRLASASLTTAQIDTLIPLTRSVGPMELPKLLPAFEQHADEARGMLLLSALAESQGLRGLRADLIQTLLAKYPAAVQSAGQTLRKELNASIEEQTAVLEKTLQSLPPGDLRRGHEVFMSRKAACNTCHKLGYGGGMLGPDLTSIGKARNRRDLLEAILFPSASIVRGYEPVVIELEDGRVVGGIITGESAGEITLTVDAQKQLHLERSAIVQVLPSAVSPMPNGIAAILNPQELADLLTFLETGGR